MRGIAVIRRIVVMLCVLTGCSSQMQPAQFLISDIDRTVRAAAPAASEYVPDRLTEVRAKLATLKRDFARGDYAAVVNGAPAVMSAAQQLDGAAAARKEAILTALNQEWAVLAATVPGDVTTLQNRIDTAGKSGGRRQAVDLDTARDSLSHDTSLWSKAQAAFATGNMDEAVNIAKTLESQLHGLASSLKVELVEPAAPQPDSAAINRPESPR